MNHVLQKGLLVLLHVCLHLLIVDLLMLSLGTSLGTWPWCSLFIHFDPNSDDNGSANIDLNSARMLLT